MSSRDDGLWDAVKRRQEGLSFEIRRDDSGNALNRAHRRRFPSSWNSFVASPNRRPLERQVDIGHLTQRHLSNSAFEINTLGKRGALTPTKVMSMRSSLALFGISIAFSFLAWCIVWARYVWPVLRRQSRVDAMQPLILLHCFRFVGLSFLVPGVVSPDLPPAWAIPAAYGDLIAAVLAVLALAVLKSGVGIALVWVFNLWGSADLLYAFYRGNQVGLEPGQLGAAYFIVTVLVPLLLITHGLLFLLLLQRENPAASR